MAASETAKLLASLELKDKFSPTIKNANKALGSFDAKLSNTEGRAYKAGQQIGTGFRNIGRLAAVGFGVVAANVALGLDSLIKVEQAAAQTEAVIKSTGGAAGVTAKDVRTMAESFEALNATMGDEVIQSGANLLLTFTNIQKEAFEPTLQTALDMNTALGKGPDGLTGTIKVLGKALNDPTKGLSALSRVGITFNKEQTKRIKSLQAEGKLYEAQTIILGELDKRFGGSFLAQGGTTAGKVAKFTDSIEDLQRSMATALLPAVGNIADALSELLADPEIQRGAENLGREIGKIFSKENVKAGAEALGKAFALIRDAAPAIQASLGTVASVLGTAFKAFTSLPKEVQALLIGGVVANKLTGGLVTNIAGGIFGALKAMTVQAGIVHLSGPVAGLPGKGGVPPIAGAGGAAGAAAGISTAAALIPIAAGVAVSVISTLGFAERNNRQEEKGLTQAERVAVNYYNSDKTQQQQIYKRLGYVPDKQDANTGNQKLESKVNALGVKFGRFPPAIDKVKVAAQETKREAQRGLAIVKSQTQTSGSAIQGTTRSSAAGIEAAVRASRPIITVDVDVSSTNVTRVTTKTTRSGPTGGSRNADSSGSGTLGNGGR
jgi:hypothetical protein